jgi:hypothetical protein
MVVRCRSRKCEILASAVALDQIWPWSVIQLRMTIILVAPAFGTSANPYIIRDAGCISRININCCQHFLRQRYHPQLSHVALDTMADASTSPRSRRPKSRQSLAHVPSTRTAALKDNATTDIAALQAEHGQAQAAKKKSRGKSIGPGGLGALDETTGNIAKVTISFMWNYLRVLMS